LVWTHFWRKIYFRERPIFGKKYLILEHAQHVARKQHAEKRRKSSMQEEKQRSVQEDKPNHDRVRVFEKYCNGYKPIKWYK
jgi:hypothetical protein